MCAEGAASGQRQEQPNCPQAPAAPCLPHPAPGKGGTVLRDLSQRGVGWSSSSFQSKDKLWAYLALQLLDAQLAPLCLALQCR